MDKWQALQSFWSGYGIPAYDENSVFSGENSPNMPYITYEAATGSIDSDVLLSASLWYRSTSWSQISQKADEIADEIGTGGKIVPYDGGAFWVKRGQPFAQRMSEPNDDAVRRMYLNISVEFLSDN